ncbi:phosphoinositide 3-kinase adapter protein 1 [Trichonephila inaurata madagascariensis]|uniref:Phosphoinositide 3-kinase adapter protein 1 n=1 Tax=Trichonephila inaurata madagascariensis TaxID=2747483 RepID=A0A8X7CJB7_9ARAC|nr:phosphoinositide 3-kinase adapter protein 1 [Trichonephila inaurata madagascariensis]
MPSSGRKKHSKQKSMSPPDVTFIFGEDVIEWDSYLSRQFEGSGTVIHHEQVEKMVFPLACTKAHVFSDARVVLVILSPALVAFLDKQAAECFQFTKLLKPSKTIAMVCGASQSSIAGIKNVLVSFDEWRHLEAKDKDINMVRNVIEMIHETLTQSKESERITKPKFKLVPRKVHEGNGKVYVMLAKPMDNNASVRITLEAKGAREVPVKKRNPYTLVFVIPDDFIHVQNMVNVHIWCGEDLMGVSSVKCASKLGELYSLLSSVPSPYEFLRSTLGVGSLHEVDFQLASNFRKNLPHSGFHLLESNETGDKCSTKEFPTLLHFAARYGLFCLVKELLDCPGAQTAATLKNSGGLIPTQIANREGHNKVAALLDEFWRTSLHEKHDLEKPVPCNQIPVPEAEIKSNPIDYYDIPAHPIPVLHLPMNQTIGNAAVEQDSDYMKMKGAQKENIEPCQNVFLDEHLDSMKSINSAEKAKLSLLESQAKLIEIMETYKKGASLTEVEKLHNEWKLYYEVSDHEAKSTLDGLRNLYAKAQKAKMNKKHSSSFSELRQFLNSKLRRKESIDSKSNMSRRNSKDSNSSEKLSNESDPARPVSTLSVLSNTSSSSGSSFDRLSTVSAGSDSGHHSDFCDDRNSKFRERYESRYQQQQKALNGFSNSSNISKNVQTLTLNSKPPAPPPRPIKSPLHYGSLEDCKHSELPQYAVSRKIKGPSFEDALKLMDYSVPNSKSSTLNSDFRIERKGSERYESRYHHQQQKALNGFSNSSNISKNVQTLTLNSKPPAPPPRPIKSPLHYGSLEDCKHSELPQYAVSRKIKGPSFEDALKLMDYSVPNSKSSTLNSDFRIERKGSVSSSDFSPFDDYDRPPPPRPSNSSLKLLPREFCLSPTAFTFNDPKTDYDMVPPPLPLSSPPIKQDSILCEIDQSYDIPPSFPQPVKQRSNSVSTDYDFPKTILMDNTDTLPACTCQMVSNKNNLSSVKSCCIGNKLSSLKRLDNLPSVPNFDISVSKDKEKQNNIANEVRASNNQYSNIFLSLPKNECNDDDGIPNEMAPPPPIIEEESPEEHYKMVGTPIPIPGVYKIS